jgi:hypothetical protein
MANRTSKGNVTATARKAYGDKEGRFPIFDVKSATSAIKLRGHANSPGERLGIIRRAAKYAPSAARRAREADKKR